MKTAEQIREKINYHESRINGMLGSKKSLEHDIKQLAYDMTSELTREDADPIGFALKLDRKAIDIKNYALRIQEEQKIIMLLEWVLASDTQEGA